MNQGMSQIDAEPSVSPELISGGQGPISRPFALSLWGGAQQVFRGWLILLICGMAIAARAQTTNVVNPATNAPPVVNPAEDIAFKAAAQEFNVGLFEKAAQDFAEFAKRFPNSERVPEVLLCQAQAQLKLKQYEIVIKGLEANLPRAGKIADKYRLLMADAYYQRGDFPKAAATYAQVLKDYPDSFLRANASYSEALCWYRMNDLTNTLARLEPDNSAFHKVALTQTNDEYVLRGYLLLAETFLHQNDFKKAEETLHIIVAREQAPEIAWQRQYLMARILLAGNRAGEAVPGLTNLTAAATATGDRGNQANTIVLEGKILQAANQLTNAIQLYEQQRANLPADQQKAVLRQLIEWHTQMGNLGPAIVNLELFASQFPQDPALDEIRLSLGEMRINQYQTFVPGSLTNATEIAAARATILNQAQTNLDSLLSTFPKSPLIGQAQLFRGWCLWEAGKFPESRDAYKDAAEKLPLSTNQMNARFQYAQALYKLADGTNAFAYRTNAIANYWMVADQYGAFTNASFLCEQALYQIVRASEHLGDAVTAGRALDRLLKQFPQSPVGDRCLLLVGQILDRQEHTAEARNRYADLLKLYPNSELAPEAKLAMAHSFMRESNWNEAKNKFDGWVTQYTNHPKIADVEFDRAWCYGQAANETNAYQLFTNFMARFPLHPRAQMAQFWVGNYFLSQGKYQEAEENYQLLYHNTNFPPAGVIKNQARYYAAQAAYKRQAYSQASNYLASLIKNLQDANTLPDLLSLSYILYGDTLRADAASDKTNSVARFVEAIKAYKKIPDGSAYAPQALGLIADCYFQIGNYAEAMTNYASVMGAPGADIHVRSQAKVGVALMCEKLAATPGRSPAEQKALSKQALDHYLDIVYGKNLLPGEKPSAHWVSRAGLDAGRMLGEQGLWTETVSHYKYLLNDLIKILPPNSKDLLEKKLDYAKKQAG